MKIAQPSYSMCSVRRKLLTIMRTKRQSYSKHYQIGKFKNFNDVTVCYLVFRWTTWSARFEIKTWNWHYHLESVCITRVYTSETAKLQKSCLSTKRYRYFQAIISWKFVHTHLSAKFLNAGYSNYLIIIQKNYLWHESSKLPFYLSAVFNQ